MDMEHIETQLKKLTPELSMHESQVLWSRVEGQLSPRGVKAPKRRGRRFFFRAITAGFVILGLLGGSVVTAAASEALPGDALYPTKITIERAQILLSPQEKKKDLQLAFADRRIKEVSTVLADVEEETSELSMPALMAVSLPSPETASVDSSAPSEVDLGDAQESVMMMRSISETDSAQGGEREKNRVPAMAKSAISQAETSTQGETFALSAGDAGQVKKWKNLDKKKKALTAAIRELERSRKELEQSGATSTSERVDSVIVNLTELNMTGTTADDGFVEKMKSHGDDMLKEDGDEPKEDVPQGETRESSYLRDVDRTQQVGVAVLAVGEDGINETQREIEQVKNRNEERRKKLQQDIRERQANIREEREREEKRIPVCLDRGGMVQELLILEKNISDYTSRGFLLGPCSPVDQKDSHIPQD